MDIQEYLSAKQKSLEAGSHRIVQFKVFDFNYIPAEPLMREEAKPITVVVFGVVAGYLSPDGPIAIGSGPVSQGRTHDLLPLSALPQ